MAFAVFPASGVAAVRAVHLVGCCSASATDFEQNWVQAAAVVAAAAADRHCLESLDVVHGPDHTRSYSTADFWPRSGTP